MKFNFFFFFFFYTNRVTIIFIIFFIIKLSADDLDRNIKNNVFNIKIIIGNNKKCYTHPEY